MHLKLGYHLYPKLTGLEDFTNSWEFFSVDFCEYLDNLEWEHGKERNELLYFRGTPWGGIRLPTGHDKFILNELLCGGELLAIN